MGWILMNVGDGETFDLVSCLGFFNGPDSVCVSGPDRLFSLVMTSRSGLIFNPLTWV